MAVVAESTLQCRPYDTQSHQDHYDHNNQCRGPHPSVSASCSLPFPSSFSVFEEDYYHLTVVVTMIGVVQRPGWLMVMIMTLPSSLL
jgi:hypothetical protein